MTQKFVVPIDVTVNGAGFFQGIRRRGMVTMYSDKVVIVDFGAFAFNGALQMAEQFDVNTGRAIMNMPRGGFEIWTADLARIKWQISMENPTVVPIPGPTDVSSAQSPTEESFEEIAERLVEQPETEEQRPAGIPLDRSAIDEDMFNGIPIRKRGRPKKEV